MICTVLGHYRHGDWRLVHDFMNAFFFLQGSLVFFTFGKERVVGFVMGVAIPDPPLRSSSWARSRLGPPSSSPPPSQPFPPRLRAFGSIVSAFNSPFCFFFFILSDYTCAIYTSTTCFSLSQPFPKKIFRHVLYRWRFFLSR